MCPADQPTIAAAINASANGDVIAIAAGTYYESNLNPNGKAITIQGTLNSDGTLATTIDANQNGNGFILNSGEGTETVIRDLVLTGAMATNASALYLDHSTCSIINCLITGNPQQFMGNCWVQRNNWLARYQRLHIYV